MFPLPSVSVPIRYYHYDVSAKLLLLATAIADKIAILVALIIVLITAVITDCDVSVNSTSA